METKNKAMYEAPTTMVVFVRTEGFICGSNDNPQSTQADRQIYGDACEI